MNPDRFTLPTQQSIVQAQELARQLGHSQVISLHIAAAMLQDRDGIVYEILRRADPHTFANLIKSHLLSINTHLILPYQDWQLSSERINTPGTVGPHNWNYRINSLNQTSLSNKSDNLHQIATPSKSRL